MRITVLGGYGNAGTEIIRLAARFTDHTLTIAGPSAERARVRAVELTREGRVSRPDTDPHRPARNGIVVEARPPGLM